MVKGLQPTGGSQQWPKPRAGSMDAARKSWSKPTQNQVDLSHPTPLCPEAMGPLFVIQPIYLIFKWESWAEMGNGKPNFQEIDRNWADFNEAS